MTADGSTDRSWSLGSAFKEIEMRAARSLASVLVGLLLFGTGAYAQEEKKKDEKPDISQIPKAVMDALKEKFPKAEIRKWT